jgi:hypothetical protein
LGASESSASVTGIDHQHLPDQEGERWGATIALGRVNAGIVGNE